MAHLAGSIVFLGIESPISSSQEVTGELWDGYLESPTKLVHLDCYLDFFLARLQNAIRNRMGPKITLGFYVPNIYIVYKKWKQKTERKIWKTYIMSHHTCTIIVHLQ
jgi:hypothetical protein